MCRVVALVSPCLNLPRCLSYLLFPRSSIGVDSSQLIASKCRVNVARVTPCKMKVAFARAARCCCSTSCQSRLLVSLAVVDPLLVSRACLCRSLLSLYFVSVAPACVARCCCSTSYQSRLLMSLVELRLLVSLAVVAPLRVGRACLCRSLLLLHFLSVTLVSLVVVWFFFFFFCSFFPSVLRIFTSILVVAFAFMTACVKKQLFTVRFSFSADGCYPVSA